MKRIYRGSRISHGKIKIQCRILVSPEHQSHPLKTCLEFDEDNPIEIYWADYDDSRYGPLDRINDWIATIKESEIYLGVEIFSYEVFPTFGF